MNKQEFYIWLLNCDRRFQFINCEFDPEFLKNYEIAKLLLEKQGTQPLNKEQQKSLNPEAAYVWFRVSKNIKLKYDIPEMLELLPERIIRYLDLRNSEIKSLPQLKSVGGCFDLYNSKIESLPKMESVGGNLGLFKSEIQSLPELESVGGNLNLGKSKIQSLPKLESVGGAIYTSSNYWKNYFRETGRSHLAEKVLLG